VPVDVAPEPITSYGARSVYLAALDELARRYERGTFREALEEYEPPRGIFLVARLDGHLVGGVGVRPILGPGDAAGEVKRLWVRPDQRRHGVATSLMTALEAASRDLGYRRLYLETGPRQPEAIALYASAGWVGIESFPEGAVSHPHSLRFSKDL
jgi:GNAT superfamily N-acetyltransferase